MLSRTGPRGPIPQEQYKLGTRLEDSVTSLIDACGGSFLVITLQPDKHSIRVHGTENLVQAVLADDGKQLIKHHFQAHLENSFRLTMKPSIHVPTLPRRTSKAVWRERSPSIQKIIAAFAAQFPQQPFASYCISGSAEPIQGAQPLALLSEPWWDARIRNNVDLPRFPNIGVQQPSSRQTHTERGGRQSARPIEEPPQPVGQQQAAAGHAAQEQQAAQQQPIEHFVTPTGVPTQFHDPLGDTLVARFPGFLQYFLSTDTGLNSEAQALLQLFYSESLAVEARLRTANIRLEEQRSLREAFIACSDALHEDMESMQKEIGSMAALFRRTQGGRSRAHTLRAGRHRGNTLNVGTLPRQRAEPDHNPSLESTEAGLDPAANVSGGDWGVLEISVSCHEGPSLIAAGGDGLARIHCFELTVDGGSVFDDRACPIAAGKYLPLKELVDLYGPSAEWREKVKGKMNNYTNPSRGGRQFQFVKLGKRRLEAAGVDELVHGGSVHGLKLLKVSEAESLLRYIQGSNGTSTDNLPLFAEGGVLEWVVRGDTLMHA